MNSHNERADVFRYNHCQFNTILLGGIFATGRTVAAMFRDTEDSFNNGFGGAAVGAFAGLSTGKIHGSAVRAVGFGIAATLFTVISKKLQKAPTPLEKKYAYASST